MGTEAIWIPLVIAGISAGTAVYSSQQQAKTAVRVQDENARLANEDAGRNARALDMAAKNKELELQEGVRREQLKQRRVMAALRQQLAGSGTDITTGTPLLIMGEAEENFQMSLGDAARASSAESQQLRESGQLGLWKAKATGNIGKFEAQLGKRQANIDSAAAVVNAASSAYGSYAG